MRMNIVHEGAAALTYAIREIVSVARRLEACGVEILWENIGDPIGKGEAVAPWIVQTVHEVLDDAVSWGYGPTAGMLEAREFLAAEVNRRGGVQVTPDDILFFNGLGDAVAKVYGLLRRQGRVLLPSPVYGTHSTHETLHSGKRALSYPLDPHSGWIPDLADVRRRVRENPTIAAICLVNPDNPTGVVYPREILKGFVQIAREHDVLLICDEIYAHIVYNGRSVVHLSELAEDTCAVVMRGISKEIPWPGSRCGWIEILNRGHDEVFDAYARSLLAAKRMEVCSTTLPQLALPRILGDERYSEHLAARADMYEERAQEAFDALRDIPRIVAVRPDGAFYFTVVFEPGAINGDRTLTVATAETRELVEGLVASAPDDLRFVYYLLASTGICVVPLRGFNSELNGFRFTLLEHDDARRARMLRVLREAVGAYVTANA